MFYVAYCQECDMEVPFDDSVQRGDWAKAHSNAEAPGRDKRHNVVMYENDGPGTKVRAQGDWATYCADCHSCQMAETEEEAEAKAAEAREMNHEAVAMPKAEVDKIIDSYASKAKASAKAVTKLLTHQYESDALMWSTAKAAAEVCGLSDPSRFIMAVGQVMGMSDVLRNEEAEQMRASVIPDDVTAFHSSTDGVFLATSLDADEVLTQFTTKSYGVGEQELLMLTISGRRVKDNDKGTQTLEKDVIRVAMPYSVLVGMIDGLTEEG